MQTRQSKHITHISFDNINKEVRSLIKNKGKAKESHQGETSLSEVQRSPSLPSTQMAQREANEQDRNHEEPIINAYHVPSNPEEDDRSIFEVNNSNKYGLARPLQEPSFEIKGTLLNALPKFHGLESEDPYCHLELCQNICRLMKPQGASLENVLHGIFSFTLEGKARHWFFTLPSDPSNFTWDQLKATFLERFFPASKTTKLKREISHIAQNQRESLYEFWSRFLSALRKCPNHQFSRACLVQYFYEGLIESAKDFIDACANGSLLSLSANNAWELLNKTISSRQQFHNRGASNVSFMEGSSTSTNLEELYKRMEKLEEQVVATKSCSFCSSTTHDSNDCSLSCKEVNALFQRQGNYNPYSNTYNQGWRDHPNFSWRSNNALNPPQPRGPMMIKNNLGQQEDNSKEKNYALLVEKVANLEQMVTQLTNAFHELKARDGTLPSNTINNPK